MRSEKKLYYHYILLQSSYYAVAVCLTAFVVPVLQKQGFTSMQIGLFLGVRALFSVLFQPVFANLIDRFDKKIPFNYFIALMVIATIILTFIQLMNPGFIWMLLIFVFYGVFTFGLATFIDAMSTLYFHVGKQVNYPVARGAGSLSFALFSLVIGMMVEAETILWAQFFLLVPLLMLILTIEPIKGLEISTKEQSKQDFTWKNLFLKYPIFAVFLVAVTFSFIGNAMVGNFLIDAYRLMGGNSKIYGIGMFLIALSEVPAALLFTKLVNRFGIYRLMCISFFFSALRVLVITFAPTLTILVFAQVLQMFGNGLFWAGNVTFIRHFLPAKYAVKAQAAVGICYQGLGNGIGSILSGYILGISNLQIMMFASLVFSLLGLFILLGGRKLNATTSI